MKKFFAPRPSRFRGFVRGVVVLALAHLGTLLVVWLLSPTGRAAVLRLTKRFREFSTIIDI